MKVEVGRRKREPSQVFLPRVPPPKQLEPLGLEETSSSDCTGMGIRRYLIGKSLIQTPRSEPQQPYPFMFLRLKTFRSPNLSSPFPIKSTTRPELGEIGGQ